jgi:hypothetical protein
VLAAAGVAAILVALWAPATWLGGEAQVANYSVDIEAIDSDGDLVMVTQENDDSPLIVWVNEVDG